jgi:hypothetical protein
VIRRLIRDIDAVDQYATVCRRLEPRHHPEQSRFAAPGSSEDAKQLTAADLEVDRINRDKIAEMLADILYLDKWSNIVTAVS